MMREIIKHEYFPCAPTIIRIFWVLFQLRVWRGWAGVGLSWCGCRCETERVGEDLVIFVFVIVSRGIHCPVTITC